MARPSLPRWLRSLPPGAVLEALGSLEPDAAIFAVDADQNIVYWSPGAERLLGLGAADLLGQHCLKANRCVQCMAGCGIQQHGAVRDVPLTLHRSDGTPVALRKTAQAFFDSEGRFAGGLEILRWDDAPPPDTAREDEETFQDMISRAESMRRVFDVIRQVAATEGTVLIRGESGTGKELVARALHAESHRSSGPFVAINCAALSPTLLESELFGHARGAFTGAVREHRGVFERADGGTLFLDEIGELPMTLQAKLLRVIQERSFTPVGGTRPVEVDVRLISATHRSLRGEAQAGRFREDLMYRLRVIPIFLPPLRERRGDVELLMERFIDRHNRSHRRRTRRVRAVSPEATRALLDHSWPGNVRELQNVIEYAFSVGRGPEISLDQLPPEFREHRSAPAPAAPYAPPAPAATARRLRFSSPEDERAALLAALEDNDGHVGRAAAQLGVSRPTFWRRRKKHGI